MWVWHHENYAGLQSQTRRPAERKPAWLVRASPPENASSASTEVNRAEGAHVSGDVVDSGILVRIVIDPDPRSAAVGGAE